MGQSMGLSLSQQDNSICSQQGIAQFSIENSGVTVMMPTSRIEIIDMIVLHIGRIYNKFPQKFQVFYLAEISRLF